MNILFISFSAVSLRADASRSVAMVRALADAGHRVDLVAPLGELDSHPHVRILMNQSSANRWGLIRCAFRAASRLGYDAIHAVDGAVFFAYQLSRLKKIPLVYDARQRYSKASAGAGRFPFGLFARHRRRLEQAVLARSDLVFSTCESLSADLGALQGECKIVQVADVPVQVLMKGGLDGGRLFSSLEFRPSSIVLCSVTTGSSSCIRSVLLVARKVVDLEPKSVFVFRGVGVSVAGGLAQSLGIEGHCLFPDEEELSVYLQILPMIDAALLVPCSDARYVDPWLYALQYAGVPLVSLSNSAYEGVLDEDNSVMVPESVDSMAEGVLRMIREPLISVALAANGQQQVAEGHTYSSFKHQVRMSYYQAFRKES